MRYALLLTILGLGGLAGCPRQGTGGECMLDSDCGSEVCARDGECMSPTAVQSIRVTWTLSGRPASTVTCTGHEDLFVHFEGPNPGETIGFAPVPCFTGQFSIDKLPKTYDSVEVGAEGGSGFDMARISGPEVTVDLPF